MPGLLGLAGLGGQAGQTQQRVERQGRGVDVTREAQGVQQHRFGFGQVARHHVRLAEVDQRSGNIPALEVFAKDFQASLEMLPRLGPVTGRQFRETEIAICRSHPPAILGALA